MQAMLRPKPKIAIPLPISTDSAYNQRSYPDYARAVEEAGGEAQPIALDLAPEQIVRLVSGCQGVLLPGSPADVDPQKFGETRDMHTAAADPAREDVDALLLQQAYEQRKPVLGICYGLQSLNVWRGGSLVQHINSPVNHEAGRKVPQAHKIRVEPVSRLATILASGSGQGLEVPVNSSHHQAAAAVGQGLRAVAISPDDQVIEAVEGTSPEHFVLAVQWHPERSLDDENSRALFCALISAAGK
jgi:putative glutamine amidotransferase